MRVAAIALFNRAGERRVLRFHPGLNVVTGWSGTGKSSVLDIIEFCLGRTDPSYPVGVLTETVAWFAAELEHDAAVLTVARPAAGGTSAAVHNAMIRFATSVDDLELRDLVPNAEARTIRAELTRLLGIPANEVRSGTIGRPPLAATASHALLLCFQAQSEIANKAHLFHRADNDEVEDAIRSTLPYFVGAVDVDTIALRQELDNLRRELRRTETRLERARIARAREVEGAAALIAEAAVLGLSDVSRDLRGLDAIAELARVRDLEITTADTRQSLKTAAVLGPLEGRQQLLTGQLAGLEHRLAVLARYAMDQGAYEAELEEQGRRLEAIGLMPDGTGDAEQHSCPLCGHEVDDAPLEVDAIRRDLSNLNAQLGDLRGTQPAATDRRGQLEDAIAGVRDELSSVTAELDAAVRTSAEVTQTGDLRARRAFLQGRVTEFLSSLPVEEDLVARLERDLQRLEADARDAEERLNPTSFAERTQSLLRVISEDVSSWARDLRLGYSDHGIQIDPNALTIVADTRQGPVDLDRMGSAANIMGYHVAAHLALHKWFIEQSRPVPAFLILDQPSQVFYPDDVRRAEDEAITDEDRERITSLYALMLGVIRSLNERLQVIVVDHANLDEAWFQERVVENWRNGRALVPQDWMGSAG
jgi:hypothetical protein